MRESGIEDCVNVTGNEEEQSKSNDFRLAFSEIYQYQGWKNEK